MEVHTQSVSGTTNQFGAILVKSGATENFPLLLVNTQNLRCLFFAAYNDVYAQFYQVDSGYMKPVANGTTISGTLYYIKKAS